jgi:C4-dicarboxylate transporter DctM subunit
MAAAVLFVVSAVLLAIGVPVGISLGMGMVAVAFGFGTTQISFLAQSMYSGFESLPLTAIPCFMLAGAVMETGGLSKRLVNVANKLVGFTTGGLGTATVLACMFFGAISGSGLATVAAIGGIMIPYMVKMKYDRTYSVGLSAAAGGLGIIVPPSIPLVVYGVATNTSIGDLFLAGIGPALIVGALLILVTWRLALSRRRLRATVCGLGYERYTDGEDRVESAALYCGDVRGLAYRDVFPDYQFGISQIARTIGCKYPDKYK